MGLRVTRPGLGIIEPYHRACSPSPTHVAFGAGIHLCVGQLLARLEAEMLMMALVARVERIDIVGEPQRKLSNSLRQFASLPVELIAAQ
jgi:4-methoxybenzoate monooxygenase (O-demethylating)